jgi:anaerobic selenocysteine-containing dehydrogenase
MPPVRHSICALDCPDACSLLVTIENGRATRLAGDPSHPVTRGFLCAKVTRYLEREYSPSRLLYPQKRTGAKGEGRFERIGWDEALDVIAAQLQSIAARFGPEAVLPYSYAGTMGLLNGSGMDRRFFHRLGASRLDRTICSAAGGAALMDTLGFRYGTEPEQFRHSKLILAWGANILGANAHLWPSIVEARRNGAKLYTIDPVMNRTGRAADRHFFINPGSDAALALGMMHVLIGEGLCDSDYVARHTCGFETLRERVREFTPERVAALTGLAAEDIVSLAREYGAAKPAAIRINYGIQRSERGAMAVRAISMLPALTGSWRTPGGGLLLSTSGAFAINREALERPDLQPRPARLVNMSELGKALTLLDGPPVKALVVYNSNPAAVAPNQNLVLEGLRRGGLFTVVLEQFQTDTADYADIVLPVTTFLEHTDLYMSYGHYYLQLARPALTPPGECRSNVEIFRALARRMGFADACFGESEDDMIRGALDSGHEFLRGITLERLERERSVRLSLPEPFLPFAEGRCNLAAGPLDYTPPIESRLGAGYARHPLELISPKNDDSMNSTFGNRPEVDAQTSALSIHADDARARGIADGCAVRVYNDRGGCTLRARIDGSVAPGVVCARAVRWNKLAPCRRNVNALTSDRLTDAGGGPTFYSCLVEVEACGD